MTYSFNAPVTTDEYTHLRQDHYQADMHFGLVDNVVALACSLSAAEPATSGSTSAVLPYDTVIEGSYTNVDEGMVVIVSPVNDPRWPTATRLRVRFDSNAGVVADSSHIYVSEFSDLLTIGNYIWVYYTYDLIDSLSRPTGVSPSIVQYEDYNHPFETMAPVIRGTDDNPLQTAYASYVTSGTYDIDFDVSGTSSPQSGATIATYHCSVVPTGSGVATVISGDPDTAIVGYSFTPGEYWMRWDATDSLGVSYFRHVLIKAYDHSTYQPNDDFEGCEITRDYVQGPAARVKFYDGVDTLINGTMAVVWMDELYSDEDFGNSATSLFGNIALVGWIETEENEFQTDPTYSAYAEVAFEIQGVGARLARIEGQLLAITNSASPSAWDQIKNLTPWRAVVHFLQRHTQALHLCDFTSNDLTDTYLFPTITTIAGNALDNVSGQQGIAWQIRSGITFARDGRMLLETRADFYDTPGVTLTQVATWNGEDLTGNIRLRMNQYIQYGFLNGDGAMWDGSAAAPLPFLCRAPGLAQSSGTDQGQFNNQILPSSSSPASAQASLNHFGGVQYAILNNTTELTITHFGGYWWLETSYGQFYVWDLDASYNVRGIVLDGNTIWMIKSVTMRHDNKTGDCEVQAVYIPIVSGFPATTVPIINNTALTPPPILPPMPAFNFELPETSIPDAGLPSSPTTPPTTDRTGQIVLEVNDSGAALSITQNYILLTAPTWRAYTPPLPSGYLLTDACFDQLGSTGGAVAVYALANNGTDSIIFYNANVLDGSSAWSQTGTPFSGVYTQIRAAGTAGSVLVYGTGTTLTPTTYDFTAAAGPFTAYVDPTYGPLGTWVMGSGWESVNFTGNDHQVTIVTNSDPDAVKISFGLDVTQPIGTVNHSDIYENSGADTLISVPLTPGIQTTSWIGPQSSGLVWLNAFNRLTSSTSGKLVISAATFWTSTPTSDAVVRVSTDYGATVGSAVDVGTSPGATGGFDLIRAGGVSYAAISDALKKASTLGGAYSAFASLSANVISVCIPYYQVGSNSSSQTTASNPQVVVGYDAPVSGSCVAWIDGSGTVTPITNPVSGATFTLPDCITMLRGKKIAIIVNVSGVRKLYVAEDLAADGSCTWTFVKNVGATATLRSRRNDPRNAAHRGQLYVFDDTDSGYSSKWASATEWNRVSPASDVLAGDILG